MTWFDGVIIGIIAFSTYWSYRQGFILEVAFFVGTIVGLLLAFVTYPFLTPFFSSILNGDTMGATVAFLFMFAVGGLLITLLGMFLQKFVAELKLRGLDRLLGGLIGFVKAVIGVSVMVVILTGIQSDNPPRYLNKSMLAEPLVNVTTRGMKQVPPLFETFMEDYGKPSMKWVENY